MERDQRIEVLPPLHQQAEEENKPDYDPVSGIRGFLLQW
jgi:hypothetical protein